MNNFLLCFLAALILTLSSARADPPCQVHPCVETVGPPTSVVSVAIANNTSISGPINLGTSRVWAIQGDPTAWTAAALTFQGSADCVTYGNLREDSGAEIAWIFAAQDYVVAASPAKWQGIQCLKIRSGTSSAPVNQLGARTLTLITVP
jgi:hypothetical protein